MYVRTRQNPNGSISVLLISSRRVEGRKHPQPVLIKSFGTSNQAEKIKELVQQASSYKEKIAQARSSNKKHLYLCGDAIDSCNVHTIGFQHFYGGIFKRYFGDMRIPRSVNRKTLEDLSILRIALPASKLKTSAQASRLGVDDLTINKIYKFMDSLDDVAIEKLKQSVYQHTKELLGTNTLKVLFYDLTTIYFEANSSSELKEFGFSKDGKHQHVQISLALIVTDSGLPVGYEIFKGNTYEGNTLLPVLTKLREQYKVSKVSIVADSAMMSKENLALLRQNGFEYIVAARIRNLSKKLVEQILSPDTHRSLNDDVSYKVIPLEAETLVVYHSESRHRKDEYDRALSIKRAEKYIGSSAKSRLAGALRKPYIALSKSSQIVLDQEKLEENKKLDGHFGIYTNIKNIDPGQALSQYKGLWQIEQTFRITKHNLAIRPVYHWKDRRIKAHFAICFLALTLVRTAEYLSAKFEQYVPVETLHSMLNEIQLVRITHANETFYIRTDIPEKVRAIYAVLRMEAPRVLHHTL